MSARNKTKTYVVYVNFPTSSKEYCYLCTIPGLSQGDHCMANGQRVVIVRTADHDPRAIRYVQELPNQATINAKKRATEIKGRLADIERGLREASRYAALAKSSPEAKKLVAELRKLKVS